MDFSTVRKKLANGSYSTLQQFEVGNLCLFVHIYFIEG